METIAAGRLAFWEGGGLWVFDVPGEAEAPNRNAMHAQAGRGAKAVGANQMSALVKEKLQKRIWARTNDRNKGES